MLDFDRLKAPEGDGDVLIEPPLDQWSACIDENLRRRETASFTLAGRPASEVVARTRAALYGSGQAETPVIACGHQPAFVHPGVWAKNVVVRRAADQRRMVGANIVVDNDAPGSFAMTVPVVDDDGLCHTESVTAIHAAAGAAYEGQPALGAEAIDTWGRRVATLIGDRYPSSMMATFFNALRQPVPATDFIEQYLSARRAIDRRFDAELTEYRASRAFGGPFLADLLIDAERFAAAYNAALQSYRREQNVRDARRPLPDLQRLDDRVETALWVYRPGHRRRRLWLAPGSTMTMFADAVEIGRVAVDDLRKDASSALSALSPWVVRPRALTLTLWARLLVCDLFVHGIGGAKYDRITDEIIRTYYGCRPPAFACVSATLRLPLPVTEVTDEQERNARRAARDVHFNPQRYLADLPPELLQRRAELIEQSRELRARRGDALRRRAVFRDIRRINTSLLESAPAVSDELERRVSDIHRELASNAVARSREYFYAMQPRERLELLTDRLAAGARSIPASASPRRPGRCVAGS